MASKHRRGDRAAVEDIVVIARPAAAHSYIAVVATKFTAGLLRYPGSQRKQAIKVAPGRTERRQLLQLPLAYSLAEIRLLGLQYGRIGSSYLHDLVGLTHR